jgi:hypothetical protein
VSAPTAGAPKRSADESRLRDAVKASMHGWGMATAALRSYPDFLVVGTKRGGTTSLHHHLLAHPDVVPMFPARRLKSPMYYSQYFEKGDRWYRSHFATQLYRRSLRLGRHRPNVTGESSPYYMYNPHAAARIQHDIPDVKIVILLRDPVRRAYSHYWERVDNRVEPLSFTDALAAEPERLAGEMERMMADPLYYSEAHDWYSYRDRGIYAPQLRRFFDLFPREQLLVLPSESFYRDVQSAYDKVTDFLGIARHTLATRPRHNYLPVPPMDADTQAELIEFFREHNDQTYALLGDDLGWLR